MKTLCVWDEESPVWNTTWQFRFSFDPEERIKMRTKQKMQLGRYGRQSVLQWDGVEVSEFEDHYNALSDVLKNENTDGAEDV